MASSNICSNPTRNVRVIAKIRGFTDQESESFDGSSAPWISVSKHNEGGSTEKVTISFGDKPAGGKYAYDMDYCYEQNEDFDLIFSREIKPLVSGVLGGQSASVIAYGARGSGKTCAIQGSVEKPGLATMAMTEILSIAEGIEKLITVSLYEVFHDHVYDLLDSNHPQVQVFEKAQGKIELKGLSKVAIKSISEFHKLYFSGGCNSWKAAEKIGLEVPRRSHKGLMIHILSHDKNLNTKLVGKMNFVDLAGYEDARRSNSDSTNLGESSKINKSLYALMNVVYALNANESRVPYRESKLTRVLQDSIGGTNRVLMLTCLNSSFCQDTMYTVSLASRSFQVINRVTNSIKRSGKSSTKLSSVKNGKPASASTTMKKEASSRVHLHENKSSVTTNGRKLFHEGIPSTTPKQDEEKKMRSGKSSTKLSSVKNGKPASASTTIKKEASSRVHLHENKSSVTTNGRKLFHEGIPSTTPKQAKFSLNSASAILTDASLVMVSSSQKETKSTADASLAIVSIEEEILLPTAIKEAESSSIVEKEISTSPAYAALDDSLLEKIVSPHNDSNHKEATLIDSDVKTLTLVKKEDDIVGKENQSSLINEESPPLSARLRELSNNLKSLCSLTPKPQNITTPYSGQTTCTDFVEHKTPVIEQNMRANENWEWQRFQSPREMFNNRSSGIKHSLVKDYLQFLNSASKEELKGLKGIGEKRATYILELREESPEPFKNLDDLQDMGLSAKQIKKMMKNVAGELFS